MKNNISLYDTGRIGSYTRRGEGWTMASVIGGILLSVFGVIMVMAGLFDPTVPGGVAVAGAVFLATTAVNGLLFITHRNFGLSEYATMAMDAIYSLPKEERKQYDITRSEVESLDSTEVRELSNAIKEYRKRNATSGKAVGTLIANITEYNKTAREIEEMH